MEINKFNTEVQSLLLEEENIARMMLVMAANNELFTEIGVKKCKECYENCKKIDEKIKILREKYENQKK